MENLLRKIKILEKMTRGYISYKLGHPRPLFCTFATTCHCNLACSFCPFFGKGKNEKFEYINYIKKQKHEMTTEEAKYAIGEIEKLGVIYLNFAGGEPLLRNDLRELAQFAYKKNMVPSLTTNGTLVTKELAQSFRGCFDTIHVSIHGLDNLDDELKGKKGAFKKSVEGLKLFKKYSGARVGINFVINKYNYHQIEDILNFARKNCDFISYIPINFFPEFCLEKNIAHEVVNKLLELKEKNETFVASNKNYLQLFYRNLEGKKSPVKCIAFDLSLFLGPAGEVGGCCYPFLVGNILNTDAKTLLKLGKNKKKELQKRCGGSIIFGCGEWPTPFEQPLAKILLKIFIILRKKLRI